MEKQNEEGKSEGTGPGSESERADPGNRAGSDSMEIPGSINVELLTVIGEIEGHESAPSHSKTTKYEHVLPKAGSH